MCVSPIMVKVTSRTFLTERYIDAPCGKCIECLKRRQNDWKLRICNESKNWSHFYFFTLTYRDDMLPCNVHWCDCVDSPLYSGRKPECDEWISRHSFGTDMICCSTAFKSDVQHWLKRMRIRYERSFDQPLKMKYFICAEYGPNPRGTKRPHYHGVIMTDASYYELLPAFNEWNDNYGRVDFKEVGAEREDKSAVSNYVSKYCAKGEFESRAYDISLGRIENAWLCASKNIGSIWSESLREHYERKYPAAFSVAGEWSFSDIDLSYHKNYFNGKTSNPAWKDVERILSDIYVYDGQNHRYKMPRYLRERIFCEPKYFINYDTSSKISLHLCPEEGAIEQGFRPFAFYPQPITFESKIRMDKRYVSENFVSCALAYLLSLRASTRDWENFCNFRKCHSRLSSRECFRLHSDRQQAAKLYRESSAKSSLSNFYTTNMWTHRELDE